MMRFVWIVIAVVAALVIVFPVTLLSWSLFPMIEMLGWLGLLLGVLAVTIVFGGLGVLVSAIINLSGRRAEDQDAVTSSDGTLYRVIFLLPCALFGLFAVVMTGFWLVSGSAALGHGITIPAQTFVFAIVSNVAFAAGLWNRRWRQGQDETE